MRNTIHTAISPGGLTQRMRKGPAHMRPLWSAMRAGCGVLLVKRNGLPFDLPPADIGTVVLIKDGAGQGSHGPCGFNRASVRRLAQCADSIAVISCDPIVEIYADAGRGARLGDLALVVETTPKHEFAWVTVLSQAAPGTPITLNRDGVPGGMTP